MSPSTIQFTSADAWILLSIIYGSAESGGATLRDIIAVGDGINHAIFNYGEMDDGLSRLTEGGHVARDGDRFRVTDAVVTAYRGISQRVKAPFRQMDELQRFLGARPRITDYVPTIEGSARIVTREAFDAAVQDYVGKFR
jgi:hypothetical protein